MKAIEIIGRLREKYSNKYTQTPNKDKDHYIRWLQDEYAELVMKQANGVDTRTEPALHKDIVSNTAGKLFCGLDGGFCQYEGRDKVCMQNDECVNQIVK